MKKTTRTSFRRHPFTTGTARAANPTGTASTVRAANPLCAALLTALLPLALPVVLLVLLAACTTTAERRRSYYGDVLERAQKQNLAYDPITNIDSIRIAVNYFNSHGSANEQMRANYLLARAYDDMGETPAALQYFQEAAERADTAAKNCDYNTLCRVHGHLAYLLLHHSSPLSALEEFSKADKYAALCGDTMVRLSSLTYRARAYELLNKRRNRQTLWSVYSR